MDPAHEISIGSKSTSAPLDAVSLLGGGLAVAAWEASAPRRPAAGAMCSGTIRSTGIVTSGSQGRVTVRCRLPGCPLNTKPALSIDVASSGVSARRLGSYTRAASVVKGW